MVSQLIKDGSGRLLKNSSGQLIKTRPYNEQLIANSLIGEFDADHIENIGGYCKTMYNQVNGGVNFVQTIADRQPLLVSSFVNGKSALYFNGDNYNAGFTGNIGNARCILLVLKGYKRYWYATSAMLPFANFIGIGLANDKWYGYDKNIIVNNKEFTSNEKPILDVWGIGLNKFDFGDIPITFFRAGDYNGSSFYGWLAAMAMYSRMLTPDEISFNMRAYGQRYNIAMEA